MHRFPVGGPLLLYFSLFFLALENSLSCTCKIICQCSTKQDMSRGRELLASAEEEVLVLTSVDYSASGFVTVLGARPTEFCFLHSQA